MFFFAFCTLRSSKVNIYGAAPKIIVFLNIPLISVWKSTFQVVSISALVRDVVLITRASAWRDGLDRAVLQVIYMDIIFYIASKLIGLKARPHDATLHATLRAITSILCGHSLQHCTQHRSLLYFCIT